MTEKTNPEKVEIEVQATNNESEILEDVKEEVQATKEEIQSDVKEEVGEVKDELEDIKKKENENEKKINEISLNQLETKNIKEILTLQMKNIEILKTEFQEVISELKQTTEEQRLSMELIQDQIATQDETANKLMEITAALTIAVEILNPIEEE